MINFKLFVIIWKISYFKKGNQTNVVLWNIALSLGLGVALRGGGGGELAIFIFRLQNKFSMSQPPHFCTKHKVTILGDGIYKLNSGLGIRILWYIK